MESGDERHTTRHTGRTLFAALAVPDGMVPVTVTADEGILVTGRQAGMAVDGTTAMARVRFYRGMLVHPNPIKAERWIGEGKALRVDVAKIGMAQKRLLVRLLAVEVTAESSTVETIRRSSQRVVGPSLREVDHRRGVRWNPEVMIEGGSPTSASRSAVAQALQHLERRGLILRDAPAGSKRRTHYVQLSSAGRIIARALVYPPNP